MATFPLCLTIGAVAVYLVDRLGRFVGSTQRVRWFCAGVALVPLTLGCVIL